MKEIARFIFIGAIVIYSFFSMYNFIAKDMIIKYKDCGQVVGSSMEDRPVKHGMTTDLYLLIEFEQDGFKAQEVGPTTYYKYKDKIGTTLCFDQQKQNPEFDSIWYEVHHILGAFFIFVYFILGLSIFIDWCFGDN